VRFLLDTNVLSEPTKPRPDQNVLHWLELQDEDHLFLSVISIAEIKRGIALIGSGKRSASLGAWLKNDMLLRFERRIIHVDEEISLAWGDLMGVAKRLARPLSSMDGFIAATAITKNMIVVTRNAKDFSFLNIETINPWEEISE